MNQAELYQRQQQIYRLHKRIRQYKLTEQEQRQLRKNKQQQQKLIESKFATSKVNSSYKFPKKCYDDDSPCLGYKDICHLSEINTIDTVKRQAPNPIGQLYSLRSQKSPQKYYTSNTQQSIKVDRSIYRESLSPGINRTFDSKTSLQRKYDSKVFHYLSTNNKSNNIRITTDTNQFKNKSVKEQTLNQSIKSIIKVKSSINSVKRKDIGASKQYFDSSIKVPPIKISGIKSKHTTYNKGKQNQIKPRYGLNKKSYNTNNINTEHDKSVREWNRSYYNSNAQKQSNNIFNTIKSKQRLLMSTNKWTNITQGNQENKSSLSKYSSNKKFVKRKQFKNTEKISLNQTSIFKNIKNQSKQNSYFSKVFQSIRSKNSESQPSESLLHSSCSRIPIGLSSPLSSKYFQFKHNMTLTNR